MTTLLEIFPDPTDLLALEPEDLGDLLMEIAPTVAQSAGFRLESFCAPLFLSTEPSYPSEVRSRVAQAVAEAFSRLVTFGLLIETPEQPFPGWYLLTRRGWQLDTRDKVAEFRRARVLPLGLLQPRLAEKVWPLFLRGDHDIAVFQAFKIVEVAVRDAAEANGTHYGKNIVGVSLMRDAFHSEKGPLRNREAPTAEREAEAALFAGAMGHARNPTGHHDVNLPPEEAARLIVFASHLLSIVERRCI